MHPDRTHEDDDTLVKGFTSNLVLTRGMRAKSQD